MFGRNNEDRVGPQMPPSDPPPIIPQEENQESNSFEFSFSTPTQFVELPSKGRFYLEGHPLYGKDSVEIRFMTAKDEDILTSKTLLKKGVAIDRLISNILIDKSLHPDLLLIGDKNAIIVAARISGYVEKYQTSINCPSCGSSVSHTFDLSEQKIVHGDNFDGFEIEETEEKTFIITMPLSKARVEVRLMSGLDEKQLIKTSKSKQRHNLPESPLTDVFKVYIKSVNGNKDTNMINSFVDHLPAIDSRYLRHAYKMVVPTVDLTQDFACRECGYEQEMEVPFTSDFFWPK